MGREDVRRVLVTGAASGIGLATARRFTADGATVALVDVDAEAGQREAAALGGEFIAADVADSASVAAAFQQAEERLGPLDVAYLNAGVVTGETDIARLTDEQYRRIVGVNVDGVVFGVREAVRSMEPNGGGAIVATASLAGLIAYGGDPIYALTKHAVVGLVRGVASQLEPKGITINCVCPGIVETPLVGSEAAAALRRAGFPLIAPEEIAEAVVRAVRGGGTGEAWVVQPGRQPEPYRFRGVPGPRTEGAVGTVPPMFRQS